MSEGLPPVADLLPHSGAAVLLDAVIAYSETGLSASVTISPASAFYRPEGVPAHAGIEYMAQTCGAFSGTLARRSGAPPRPGFLLGTRRYWAARLWFAAGEQLVVTAELVYRDQEVGVFDCLIHSGGAVVAKAQLIVAEPDDATELLRRQDAADDG